MLKTIIIDDERNNRIVLEQMIRRYCGNVHISAVAESADEGKLAIQKLNPDLVFLDIEMPHQNGFELLDSLQKIDFSIVFVTAHEEHRLRSQQYAPVDFLLKPINPRELRAAVEKAERLQPHVFE